MPMFEACSWNGECFPLNSVIKDGCNDLTCVKNSSLILEVTTRRCEGAYGICHDIGDSGFRYTIDGIQYPDCECVEESQNAKIKCKGYP
uniref:Uncharacterized protein n=1 Tax=Pinctada fucata TaxID=50426 RepID=A0A194ANZ1_PINFU